MPRSSQMLASVYHVPTADVPMADSQMTIALRGASGGDVSTVGAPSDPAHKGRLRIWDLHTSLHCSIVGTCLSQGELRSLLRRLRVDGVATADDHDLHKLGVLLAARPKEGGRLLQRVLDRRYRLALNRFAKAKDAAELGELWNAAMSSGDIPGAYWAVLTHPLSTEQLTKRVFGDVHMLSHLVGATNRADIRRLRELEQQNAALVERVESQQKRLRDDVARRDGEICRLSDLLAQKLADEKRLIARANDANNFLAVIRELENRLDEEIGRRQSAEQNLALVSAAYEQSTRACNDAESERNALRLENTSIEGQLDALLAPDGERHPDALDLAGLTVLYVGGRAKQVPQLRALVERVNGQFLHHDGGIDDNAGLLPGLLARANVAVFPVDCISHNAASSVKRFCDQAGRRYVPLRTSSLSCLLSALTALDRQLSSMTRTLQ